MPSRTKGLPRIHLQGTPEFSNCWQHATKESGLPETKPNHLDTSYMPAFHPFPAGTPSPRREAKSRRGFPVMHRQDNMTRNVYKQSIDKTYQPNYNR